MTDRRFELDRAVRDRFVRPEPVVWAEQAELGSLTSTSDVLVTGYLLVVDAHEHRQASVSVKFNTRVNAGEIAAMHGADPSGSLRVTLEIDTARRKALFRFRFDPTATATPCDLQALISWFRSFRPGRRLGLWAERGGWLVATAEVPANRPSFPAAYERAVAVLARIQRRSGVDFPMPSDLDGEDSRAVALADQLLRGKVVRGHWREGTISAEPDLVKNIEQAEHGVRLELLAEQQLTLGDVIIEIGTVEHRYMQALAGGPDPTTGDLRVRAGKNDQFELRLVAVPERANPSGTTSWIPMRWSKLMPANGLPSLGRSFSSQVTLSGPCQVR